MGWTSYVEDIQKVRDEVVHFQQQLRNREVDDTKHPVLTGEIEPRVAAYERILDGIVATLDKLLSVATDPTIDLVQENKDLSDRLEQTLADNAELVEKSALAEIDRKDTARKFEANLAMLNKQLKKETHRADRAEKEIERIVGEDFGIAVDAFPPSGRSK